MTRRQLFKNFGLGLAGLLALPLFGKPGKASEPGLSKAQRIQIATENYETHPSQIAIRDEKFRKFHEWYYSTRNYHGFATELNPAEPYPALTKEAIQKGITGIGYEVV